MIDKNLLENMPPNCGVYLFWEGNTPIYIGKAVNLKARLKSHLQNSQTDKKEKFIITRANRLTYQLLDCEFNALLYEAQLIKQYQPKYNLAAKDDKSPLYIKITKKELYPKILLVRRENDGSSYYFGPFPSTNIARFLVRRLRTIIPFCTQKKVTTRPCFYSKIGLCQPCPNMIQSLLTTNHDHRLAKEYQHRYQIQIRQVVRILKGGAQQVVNSLTNEVRQLSNAQYYEEAIVARNQLNKLDSLLRQTAFDNLGIERLSIDTSVEKKNQLHQFLSEYFGVTKKKKQYRIECFDVSNLSGRDAVAAMVVFSNFVPDKSQYRRFRIRSVTGISDIHMLKEAIERRIDNLPQWQSPDLLIIDGGSPQVRAARLVLARRQCYWPTIGLAKRPDRIIMPSSLHGRIKWNKYVRLFKVFQYARDESHRFAKAYHLRLRSKSLLL